MGRMDAAMKDVMASSLILSTMPSGTSDAIILIIAPLCVSLPAGDCGKSRPFSSLPSLSFLSSFCIRDANFTHVLLAAINDSTLRLTCRTISNGARN